MDKLITGAHAIIYSKDAEADRAFLRDIFGLANVDAGEGWLIFALPPAELAIHPAEKNDVHEIFFMVKDIQAFITAMGDKGVPCDPVESTSWGELTHIKLPGGGKVGVYQPRHARPKTKGQHAITNPRRRTTTRKA
ncbi:MAG: extradiol dioxygenase [Anaerolineales bacterium]|jgi:catechol 2,3-dioxygenase-like lactoylglutathione lyase family enzyme